MVAKAKSTTTRFAGFNCLMTVPDASSGLVGLCAPMISLKSPFCSLSSSQHHEHALATWRSTPPKSRSLAARRYPPT